MRPIALLFALIALGGMAYGAYLGACYTVAYVETRTERALNLALAASNDGWATVETDGLIVRLSGTAPDPAAHQRVIGAVTTLISEARIENALRVRPPAPPQPPEFFVDILRSADRFSVVGLMPSGETKGQVLAAVDNVSGVTEVTDMIDQTDWTEPEGWAESVAFGTGIITSVNHGKVSVRPGAVAFTAMLENAAVLERLERQLRETVPEGIDLSLDLSAPRPVITPFQLRLTLSDRGARMGACSAETEEARARILAAAAELGLGDADCVIGLGAPSSQWARAADLSIQALNSLGAGTLEIEDADISLRARLGTDEALFEEVTTRLQDGLPPIFSLHAFLPKPLEGTANDPSAAPRFIAVRGAEGTVRLTGALLDEPAQIAVKNFAEAQFGFGTVANDTVLREDLPEGWPARVFSGLKAMGRLRTGRLEVTGRQVILRGTAYREEFLDDIRLILDAGLPEGVEADTDLDFDPEPEKPELQVRAEICAVEIDEILRRTQITFPPGESDIAGESLPVIADIAKVLEGCPASRFEIGGHTDAQGGENTNLALSQARADAVMAALLEKGLTLVFLSAQGYGESVPIADNETEEGRARNRRIEFRLVQPEVEEVAERAPEAEDGDLGEGGAEEGGAEEGGAEEGGAEDSETADTGSGDEMDYGDDAPEADAEGETEGETGDDAIRPRLRDLE